MKHGGGEYKFWMRWVKPCHGSNPETSLWETVQKRVQCFGKMSLRSRQGPDGCGPGGPGDPEAGGPGAEPGAGNEGKVG